MPGPIPKRSKERRRVNKPDIPTKTAPAKTVTPPVLEGEHSDMGVRFYEALKDSGQSVWYQASDWALAQLTVLAIDAYVARPSASGFAAITSTSAGLLLTEGDRRKARIELDVATEDEGEGDVSFLTDARRRRTG